VQHVPLTELRGQLIAQLLDGSVDGVLVVSLGRLILVGVFLIVSSLADTKVAGNVVV